MNLRFSISQFIIKKKKKKHVKLVLLDELIIIIITCTQQGFMISLINIYKISEFHFQLSIQFEEMDYPLIAKSNQIPFYFLLRQHDHYWEHALE